MLAVPSQVLYNGILAVQIVSHIPLNNVNFPRVFMGFMLYVNKVVSFKKGLIWLDDSKSQPLNQNFYWMGYETANFFENMDFVMILLALLLIRQIFGLFFMILARILSDFSLFKWRQDLLLSSASESLNMWARFFLITYFEFVIACFTGTLVGRYELQQETVIDKVSLVTAEAFLVLVLCFPVMMGLAIYIQF